jgi:hypothetical protein
LEYASKKTDELISKTIILWQFLDPLL